MNKLKYSVLKILYFDLLLIDINSNFLIIGVISHYFSNIK